jgi:hypothetical protein
MSLAVVIGLAVMVGAFSTHAQDVQPAAAAKPKTFKINSTVSGSGASVPLDLTGDSCTVIGNVEVCTATSSLATYGGKGSGGPPGTAGAFTGQGIDQTVPVAGVGCSFAPDTIKACTIGSNNAGCQYTYVSVNGVGGSFVNRVTASGDLAFGYLTAGSYCYDGDTGAFEGTQEFITTGGTGKFAGYTGTTKATFNGATLLFDSANDTFTWFQQNSTGTLTK